MEQAYSARSAEYIDLFGMIDSTHPIDRELVRLWASGLSGEVLDVGCGPGQWTDFLVRRGVTARGIDPVPAFVEHARMQHPGLRFDVGRCESLDAQTATLGGVLAWYSLIHHEPATISPALAEIARVLRPGGGLLIGYFDGTRVESFDHAVVAGYRWTADALGDHLAATGFEVVESTTRSAPGQRRLGSISAVRTHPDDTPHIS